MLFSLPKEVRDGLESARVSDLVRKSRLRIVADGRAYPVIRISDDGFSLSPDAPHLRGLVDLYEGARAVAQCLIIASSEDRGEMRYEFKRRTEVADRPPLDFERDETAPVALLSRRPEAAP
ncbi:MAG: hypothetical protein MUE98_05670 [Rhodobacteraceae bacterium]|jgi:hypothetical protein|nr:hypothetical protein [Paracoccaceae bacterium]